MHFSWEKHLELSRNVAVASDENQGMALALMGVALTMLATDLLAHELKPRSCRPPGLDSDKVHLVFPRLNPEG